MMEKEKELCNIVLLEDVYAQDRLGMNFMRQGSKGVLIFRGEVISSVKIRNETYELPNISFLELMEGTTEDKAA